jgi:hypothetical protein
LERSLSGHRGVHAASTRYELYTKAVEEIYGKSFIAFDDKQIRSFCRFSCEIHRAKENEKICHATSKT